jgi:hypothetical protein
VGSGLITSSRLKAWRRCARYHQLRFEEGYERVVRDPVLHFGDLVHRGLDPWWRAMAEGLAGEAQLDRALAAVEGEADPFERARAEALLTGYHHRWEGDRFEVLGVELEFRAPLVNPATGEVSRHYQLAGKIDVLVRDRLTGAIYIIEHKTSSEDITPGSAYWQRLKLDGQVSMYYLGAEALGYRVDGCIYDVLGKPDLRPLKATPVEQRKYTKPTKGEPPRLYKGQRETDETPTEFEVRMLEAIAKEPGRYYSRGSVVRLEAEMERHLVDLWSQAQAMYLAAWAGEAPKNPEACLAFGRPCTFLPVCTGEASLDDARYRRGEIHPELAAGEPPLAREELDHATSNAT